MKNIKNYRQGSMEVEELDNFTNKFLNAKFDATKKSRWEEILKEKHGVVRDVVSGNVKTKSRKLYMWIAAVVAAVLLFLVVTPLIQSLSTPSYKQLATNFIEQDFYVNQGITKGNENVAKVNLDAITAYNQKDFSSAIKHWETVIANNSAEESTHFFLGLSYLNTAKYDKAIINLQKANNFIATPKFEQEIQWFLALAYIENGTIDKAKTILMNIKKRNWNYKKARQLLNSF